MEPLLIGHRFDPAFILAVSAAVIRELAGSSRARQHPGVSLRYLRRGYADGALSTSGV